MSLNKLIIDTLKPIGIPVALLTYTGTATTYITFFQYNEMGVVFAEDSEQETRHSIQIDVWSKGNHVDVVKQVKKLLKEQGFSRVTAHELYEDDTKIFHKVMQFYYDDQSEINL
ncbi:hypothetical protein MKZ08_08470 [Viridibacillus sp. FSL R5-0477]|uniref:Uncharacterized protein n=1 Tax=Viridibacillus arenosi FSL R5-213 TaxID=1227360 RepID=W4EV99_9BACL|nr:hypothetical protein [Viridibacillus arenosi]ETT84174.1 hypothetical protein C176_12438 [Viridibacillus arenosi FSL R5-213]OMC90030.1 hypothetical protein BK137_14890 [Viridibacillus arenosi]